MSDPSVPQGAQPVDGFYVEKATETYGRNHQTIYVLDGKYYINGYEFAQKQDAENYAYSMNGALPPGAEKPLTLEDRFDAVLRWLRDIHGIHFPPHLAPAPLPSEAPKEPLPSISPKE